ncbi:hypothetical protein L204_105733 [Cryptococcus depauperatus]
MQLSRMAEMQRNVVGEEKQRNVKQLRWVQRLSRSNLAALVLLYIVSIHIVGLYVFTQGFLLTRLAIPHTTPQYNDFLPAPVAATHSKAVILVIDALRTDFISPYFPEPASPYHHGVLSLPAELTRDRPDHSLIFNAYSDPPTSTMQRIKGITTGSLPTFMDISSNFASTAIEEDSLISQFVAANKTIGFMGDDTWMGLFPSSFCPSMSHPYDSFNVEDLHTVDEGVITHIFPYLHPDNQSSWDVLIGHFLGVDHVGHRVGPSRDTMTAKLIQMDEVLRNVVDMIDEETLLVVLGDHGMDDKGNHGGDSEMETSSALWLYSKGPALTAQSSVLDGLPVFTFPKSTTPIRHVNQIDLVPTLSLLLGVPIPYNNLGSVIPECFIKDLATLEAAQRVNAEGIWRYVDAYGDEGITSKLKSAWIAAQAEKGGIASFTSHRAFSLKALSLLRSLWAQFSLPLILIGSAIIGLSALTIIALYIGVRNNGTNWHHFVRLALETAIMGSSVLASIAGTAAGMYTAQPIMAIKVFIIVFALISEVIIILPIFVNISSLVKSFSINRHIGPIVLGIHSISFASNSFVMWEDRIVAYLIATIPVIYIFKALSAPTAGMRLKIIFLSIAYTILTRLASTVTICREEQQPYCSVTFFSGITSISPKWAFIGAIPLALQLPRAIGITLSRSKSLGGPAPFLLGILWRGVLVTNAVYWVLEFLESFEGLNSDRVPQVQMAKLWIARMSMGISLGAIPYIWLTSPLCITIDRSADQVTGEEKATVLGFANALGSSYILYILSPFGLIHLVSQPMAQFTLSACLVSLLVYLELVDTRRDALVLSSSFAANANSAGGPGSFDLDLVSDTFVRPSFTDVVPLALSGFLFFFATGHQSVISTIQWRSAFIGLGTANYAISPILVIINTWGSFFLTAVAVPLLAIWNISPRPRGSVPTLAHSLQLILAFLVYHTTVTFASAVTAAWLRRHLMVWKVFAPRFMLAGVTLLVVDMGVALGLVGVRVVGWKVKKTFSCESF